MTISRRIILPAGGDTTLKEAITRRDQEIATAVIGLMTDPLRVPSYTVATLPSAATWTQCLVYVSDGTSNKRLAVSDGTNWRFPDGAIVS